MQVDMLLEQLSGIKERYQEINQQLLKVGDDSQLAAELGKEKSDLDPFVETIEEYEVALEQLEQANQLSDSEDEELRALAELEITELEQQIGDLEDRLKRMLVPKDSRDDRNVILEIRAGAGGDEAGLFAGDLFRMYNRYAERKGWKVEIMSLRKGCILKIEIRIGCAPRPAGSRNRIPG
jgi:peptide chain release factor 1